MQNTCKKRKYAYCLAPCPAYDVEGMESWLSDMAKEGRFLAKDGFFAGIATFEYGTPRRVKYRLEAAQKSTSMWAEDGGEPDPEQVALSEKYAWRYLAKRGDFYIYCSMDPGTRELNTDPEIQALALNTVKRKQGAAAFSSLFWFILYPVCLLRGGLLLTMINVKTWFFLLITLFVIWMLADSLIAFVYLGRLQKKLRDIGTLTHSDHWRKRATVHHGKNFLQIALACTIICIFLHNWSASVMDEDRVQLDAYTGEIPFATMQDLAGENAVDYCETMTGLSRGINTIKAWSDYLAPKCVDYNEHAQIILSDGRVLDGGLYVDYYETVSPQIARCLAKECYRIDRWKKGFEPLEVPSLNVDFAAAYYAELHFPVILIQNGKVVIRAYFYQTSANYTMDFQDWVCAIAQEYS